MHRPAVALGRDAPAQRLTDDRCGRQCGVDAWTHRFRHHFSYTWLDRGGTEGDLMELNGWSSPQMLRRFGASARSGVRLPAGLMRAAARRLYGSAVAGPEGASRWKRGLTAARRLTGPRVSWSWLPTLTRVAAFMSVRSKRPT